MTTHYSAWLKYTNGPDSIDKETTEPECGGKPLLCTGNFRLVTCGRCKKTFMYKAAVTLHNLNEMNLTNPIGHCHTCKNLPSLDQGIHGKCRASKTSIMLTGGAYREEDSLKIILECESYSPTPGKGRLK